MLMQAGGLLGIAYLTGCDRTRSTGGDLVASGEPDIIWPDPPQLPATGYPTQTTAPIERPPVYQPGPITPPAPPTPREIVQLPEGVLPRSQWTRAGVARPQSIYALGGVNRITIHHDGMDAFTSTGFAQCAGRIETIRQSHINRSAKGGGKWADIGYHYIIDPMGRVWEGRSIAYQGAHVQDKNENNLGILCLGNYERQSPSRATMAQLDRFVASQMRRYNVPLSRVYTHRELNPTECPGRSLQSYLVRSRSRGGGLAMAAEALGVRLA